MRICVLTVLAATSFAVNVRAKHPDLAKHRAAYEEEVARAVEPIRKEYVDYLSGWQQRARAIGDDELAAEIELELDHVAPHRGAASKGTVVLEVDEDRTLGRDVHPDLYRIETTVTKGVVELTFDDERIYSLERPKTASLQVYIPTNDHSQSGSEVLVYWESRKAGDFLALNRGEWIEIPLDMSTMPRRRRRDSVWTFQLRPTGMDAAAIAKKSSGNGAKLKLTY